MNKPRSLNVRRQPNAGQGGTTDSKMNLPLAIPDPRFLFSRGLRLRPLAQANFSSCTVTCAKMVSVYFGFSVSAGEIAEKLEGGIRRRLRNEGGVRALTRLHRKAGPLFLPEPPSGRIQAEVHAVFPHGGTGDVQLFRNPAHRLFAEHGRELFLVRPGDRVLLAG